MQEDALVVHGLGVPGVRALAFAVVVLFHHVHVRHWLTRLKGVTSRAHFLEERLTGIYGFEGS